MCDLFLKASLMLSFAIHNQLQCFKNIKTSKRPTLCVAGGKGVGGGEVL